ncbi:hypothetical protein [Autumnicola psychrophila]|uniref:DUF2116 family Zn-ribbon domain-containing protein n=1 Tax=Autumnicola psychrophila TaxID=3075592 RepID=A0ABU3DUB2_9FLAO|nr:hypothetical protein [Zunongwangia sp. F225]MDT0687305.1 hypothetical protein [Zunongwangia sp. F225]
MKPYQFCLSCNKELEGRSDKKFCDAYCKSAYHYNKSRDDTGSFYLKVDRQLKLNRKILKKFNKAGKATVRSKVLLSQGFNPNFFTHYWKNSSGDVYLFVYEYGFLSRLENGKKKYILVTWQPYMEKSLL